MDASFLLKSFTLLKSRFSILCIGIIFISLPVTGMAAEAYIIVDNGSGKILASQNHNQRLQIASLTKVATAMVALDWLKLTGPDADQLIVVGPNATLQGTFNPIGLQPGDQLSFRDALYAALMQSDNISAYTLAEHIGNVLGRSQPALLQKVGPVGVFVAQMNALARTLKMEQTLFLNPTGLDAEYRKPPYSTAADMARLARYAMADSGFRFHVFQPERKITIHRDGLPFGYLLRNTNELAGKNEIDGVKTGRTARAGDCLILSAEKPPKTVQQGETTYVTPRRITVVLLRSADRFAEGAAMISRGWQLYEAWDQAGRPPGSAKESL